MNDKRRTHKAALLELLSDGREHPMSECQLAGGWRYGGRLFELRKQGYVIETIQKGVDVFAYRMIKGQGVLI